MDQTEEIRKEIYGTLCQYFGDKLCTTFETGYAEETLPIFVHNAYLILTDHVGEQKAKMEIDKILSKHSKSSLNYA